MNNIAAVPAPINYKAGFSKWVSLAFYPTGLVRIWKGNYRLWVRILYTLIGLPIFLFIILFLGIIGFAAFLPPLDLTMGNRTDRTIFFSEGHYQSTFLKTARETGGQYELVQVEVQPNGGNSWHYHKNFEEHFTVLKGKARIGNKKHSYIINEGDSIVAQKGELHYFSNPIDSAILLLVKVTPAAGLEKSIRVAYGLANDGKLKGEITENPWHMPLLLAYSGTYLPGIPGFIQEPLVNALAKIAQWNGEDKALEKYFM